MVRCKNWRETTAAPSFDLVSAPDRVWQRLRWNFVLSADRADECTPCATTRAALCILKHPRELACQLRNVFGQWGFCCLVQLAGDAAEVLALRRRKVHRIAVPVFWTTV